MPPEEKISLHTQVALALVCALAYFYAYQLNMYWFNWSEFSHGTNWVFIPSGLRLLLVLVLPLTGALGIAAASMVINYGFNVETHFYNIVTALISAAAPYLSRYIAVHFLQLNPLLSGLTSAGFFKLSVLFAVINALLHQIWFGWYGLSQDSLSSGLVMGVGDWVGTVLVLAFASLMIKGYKFTAGSVTGR
jgi:hypothetical protein